MRGGAQEDIERDAAAIAVMFITFKGWAPGRAKGQLLSLLAPDAVTPAAAMEKVV